MQAWWWGLHGARGRQVRQHATLKLLGSIDAENPVTSSLPMPTVIFFSHRTPSLPQVMTTCTSILRAYA